MNLPRDPFSHMRKIIDQSFTYAHALKHIEAMDPLHHYKRIMG